VVEGRSAASDGSSADDSITVASNEKDRNYEDRRARGEVSPKEDIEHGRGVQLLPESPLGLPPGEGTQEPVRPKPKPTDFVGEDFGKFGVGIEKPDLSINQLFDHGEFRADTRGVSADDLQGTVGNPLLVLQQSSGRFFYLSDKAVVVLDREGTVVTTYPASKFDARIKAILDYVYQRSGR